MGIKKPIILFTIFLGSLKYIKLGKTKHIPILCFVKKLKANKVKKNAKKATATLKFKKVKHMYTILCVKLI